MGRLSAGFLILSIALGAAAQHDPGRNAVQAIARGRVDEARRVLAEGAQQGYSGISEGEAHFVRAMAACAEGDLADAVAHVEAALKNGVPAERFQAGPRDVFAPLYDDAAYARLIAPAAKVLLHGPILSLSDGEARFWVRTATAADVVVRLTPATGGDALTARAATSADRDYTACLAANGLEPNAKYGYTVLVDGAAIFGPAVFRALPACGEHGHLRVAFGGGAGYTPEHERMWTTIRSRQPRALLMLGDNVYIDDPEHAQTQRYCYYRRQSQPLWRALGSALAVFAIYDDHDFGTDDCVPGPDVDSPPWKRDVWRVFRENWANPAYGGGDAQPGCWFDMYIGDVHFIMLDCRYYRDLEGGSMLGPVQKQWLFDTLAGSQGTFKVLASSVPWSPRVKPGSRDTWDGFPEEREEIFGFIGAKRIAGVLLMAADRHRSDLRRIPREGGYDLYEVMSSRLTNTHRHGLTQDAQGSEFIMGYNEKCSFGLLDFHTAAPDPQVSYRIVNIDDEVVGEKMLALSQLSFGDAVAGQ